jgi:recombination protein RecA
MTEDYFDDTLIDDHQDNLPVEEAVSEIKRVARRKPKKDDSDDEDWVKNPGVWTNVISTGSTLLDLAISGGVVRGGGIPGGIILEIFGPESSGKTTIACEAVASAQAKGGECKILDPECRLTRAYCEKMGIKFNPSDYETPETVEEVFDFLIGRIVPKANKLVRDFSTAWNPDRSNINVCMVDSIAALAGEMELNQGDAMGGNRPKQFSQGLRLSKTVFRRNNSILFLTNQLRDNMAGYGKRKTTATGNAVKFYSSVRIELGSITKLKKKKIINGREYEKVFGQLVEATIIKNSLDEPYRQAPIYIVYGYGVDDIRANLQFLKDNGAFDTIDDSGKIKKATNYVVGSNSYKSIQEAIDAVEAENKEDEIREKVIDLWEEIQRGMHIGRKNKKR